MAHRESSGYRLAIAIGLSLALHGATLFAVRSFHGYVNRPAAQGYLSARLVAHEAPAVAQAEAAPAGEPQAPTEPATPSLRRPKIGSPSDVAPRKGATTGPAAKSPPQAPAPSGAPEPAEEDTASALARFRFQVVRETARHPARAPHFAGMRDVSEVRAVLLMVVGADRSIKSLTIKKSAGRAALDRHAIERLGTIRDKVPHLVPHALRGSEFSVEIVFVFELGDDEGA